MMASTIWLWPLPSTPAMPSISPSCTSNDTPRTASKLPVVKHLQVLDAEHDITRGRRPLLDPQDDLTADHHLGESGLVGLTRRGFPHQPARPHDYDAICERHHLVQLVGDDHDRESRVDELAHDLEELVHFLGREHCCWLIENQYARLAEERLEDLDPLLHSDGQVLNQRVGIDLETVALGDVNDFGPCGSPVDHPELRGLHTEDDVLGDRKRLDEHEVLVHHADPEADGLTRALDLDHCTVNKNAARVGPQQPVRDVHQRGLPGTVLTQKRNHFTDIDVE